VVIYCRSHISSCLAYHDHAMLYGVEYLVFILCMMLYIALGLIHTADLCTCRNKMICSYVCRNPIVSVLISTMTNGTLFRVL